jgi:hypothetical protein
MFMTIQPYSSAELHQYMGSILTRSAVDHRTEVVSLSEQLSPEVQSGLAGLRGVTEALDDPTLGSAAYRLSQLASYLEHQGEEGVAQRYHAIAGALYKDNSRGQLAKSRRKDARKLCPDYEPGISNQPATDQYSTGTVDGHTSIETVVQSTNGADLSIDETTHDDAFAKIRASHGLGENAAALGLRSNPSAYTPADVPKTIPQLRQEAEKLVSGRQYGDALVAYTDLGRACMASGNQDYFALAAEIQRDILPELGKLVSSSLSVSR